MNIVNCAVEKLPIAFHVRMLAKSRLKLMDNLESVWESIIDDAGCPVVVTDAIAKDNPIVFVNSRFEELSGYSKAEVLGQNPRILHAWDKNQEGLVLNQMLRFLCKSSKS